MLNIDPNQLSMADYVGVIFQHNLKNADPNSPQPIEELTQAEMAEIDGADLDF
ncbi:MAG: hypothetical protein ACRCVX_06820 [Shewanella sp.]